MDTICSIATAQGVGSISIIRISGDRAYEIALKLSKKEFIKPRYATLSFLYDEDELIDEAIIIYFRSPQSFTGEDVVEFQFHGGVAVANLLLGVILKNGARLANPGEFSKRAFINGKMDLTKAEAIAKIIEAKSEDAIRLLSKQLRGDLKNFVDDLRQKLVEILAYIEVNIDYAEEDLPEDLQDSIKKQLDDIEQILKETVEISLKKEGLINGFSIAIIGKPNVGKSSLLNRLLNYNRAIISDVAGTTRDTIEEEIKIGTHLVKIIDTAGIRDAKDTIEKIGVQRSIDSISKADIVVAIFDLSEEFDKEDEAILELLEKEAKDKKILVFLNKSDLPNKLNIDKIKRYNPIAISTKYSVDIVVKSIKEYLDETSSEDMLLFSSKRQIQNVKDALEAIKRAKEPLEYGELELFAYEINEAIDRISAITTKFEREEILDKMFGSFCLGK